MSNSNSDAGVSRRSVLSVFAAGAAATVGGGGLLSGCAEASKKGKGNAEAESALTKILPKYTELSLVKPDLPGSEFVVPGFTKYPSTFVRGVKDKPITSGKDVTAMTPLWGPIPPGVGSNTFYDVNAARLGAQIKFNIVNGVDYGEKLNALMGAGDIPELLCVPGWNIQQIGGFAEGVDKLFEDLTPYLSGDNVKPYPMLANLPTRAWAFGAWNSKLKAVPFPADAYPFCFLYRKDLLSKMGLAEPKTADDLLSLGKALTDPAANRWAFSDFQLEAGRIFNAPAMWRKVNGKLLHKYETDEFAAAIEFMRKVYSAGYIHPNVVSNKGTDTKPLFEGGQIIIMQDGPGGWKEMSQRQMAVNPNFVCDALTPFAHDGGKAIMYQNDPANIFTFMKKGLGEARIKELLGVLNYTASPYGTEEYQLYNYGEEGKHYTRDANGAPVKTALGNKDVAQTYIFLGGRPLATTESEIKGYVEAMHAWQTKAGAVIERNPFDGIRVEMPSKMSAIATPTDDKIQDIMRSRRPMSDLKGVVTEWRNGGGDEARDFYAKVLTDNGR